MGGLLVSREQLDKWTGNANLRKRSVIKLVRKTLQDLEERGIVELTLPTLIRQTICHAFFLISGIRVNDTLGICFEFS